MTYPDPGVSDAIRSRFIPLRLDHKEQHVRSLNLIWLPTLYVLDKREVIHYRSVNALPPADLLDVLDLGEAHARMKGGQADRADRLLRGALGRRADGPLTDEVLFWSGIAAYFAGGHDGAARDAAWAELRRRYPRSVWTHRIPDHSMLTELP